MKLKKALVAAAVFMLVCWSYLGSGLTAKAEVEANFIVRTDGINLNVRSGPATSFPIVATIPNGTPILIYELEEDWGNVLINDESGWVYMSYCVPIEDADEDPEGEEIIPILPEISSTSLKMDIGMECKLWMNNLKGKVKWKTSSKKVVTVDSNGVVKAVGSGKAKVSAYKKGEKLGECEIKVSKREMTYETFESEVYPVKAGTELRNGPGSKFTATRAVNRNDAIKVCASVVNSLDNVWYFTAEGDYIYSEAVTEQRPFPTAEEMNEFAVCIEQSCRASKGGGSHLTGICNMCSMVTLLNRRAFYDYGYADAFTMFDGFAGTGCTNVKKKTCTKHPDRPAYEYSGDTGSWWRATYKSTKYSNVQYTASRIEPETVRKEIKAKNISFEEYLRRLLEDHPEGICLRNSTANHVCIVTQVIKDGGKLQMYVYDPVHMYYGPLEGSYIYTRKHNLLEGLSSLSYLN